MQTESVGQHYVECYDASTYWQISYASLRYTNVNDVPSERHWPLSLPTTAVSLVSFVFSRPRSLNVSVELNTELFTALQGCTGAVQSSAQQ